MSEPDILDVKAALIGGHLHKYEHIVPHKGRWGAVPDGWLRSYSAALVGSFDTKEQAFEKLVELRSCLSMDPSGIGMKHSDRA